MFELYSPQLLNTRESRNRTSCRLQHWTVPIRGPYVVVDANVLHILYIGVDLKLHNQNPNSHVCDHREKEDLSGCNSNSSFLAEYGIQHVLYHLLELVNEWINKFWKWGMPSISLLSCLVNFKIPFINLWILYT